MNNVGDRVYIPLYKTYGIIVAITPNYIYDYLIKLEICPGVYLSAPYGFCKKELKKKYDNL